MTSRGFRLPGRSTKLVILAAVLVLFRGDAAGRRADAGADRIRTAGEVSTFAGDPQHTAIFTPAAQDVNRIRWSVPIDLNNTGGLAHYGAPVITAANTVVVPVKTATDGFEVRAYEGASGSAKYTLTTDYILPPHNWIPPYQPALAGSRLYYSGAGGTVFFTDNLDATPPAPTRRVFYSTLPDYLANKSAFDSSVFINTPITPDAAGNVFFGFRVVGTAPAPLNTTQGGFARVAPDGTAAYVLAGPAAADGGVERALSNAAPAVSSDGTTVYVAARSGTTDVYGYLLGLDASTLATKFKVFLKDPRNGGVNNAALSDDGTASPTVAPDGDVYFGVGGNPFNGGRGFLLRFNSDLSVEKAPGGFGWDNTAAIVPKEMVPSYSGTSSYLIFSKYNDYAINPDAGTGVNKIALLDPASTEVDPHASSSGMAILREVFTMAGPTPDAEHFDVPAAVREWCINTAAVNPTTQSVFTTSEDGNLYRFDLASGSLSQVVRLTPGIGEPYVPTVVGPDGTVFTLNGGTLFALGFVDGVRIRLASSAPGDRTVVAGDPLTFTAEVANPAPGGTPTGSVTFQDTVYFVAGPGDLQSTTTVLGAGVTLDAAGHASVTTSALPAGTHFIEAIYSGGGGFSGGTAALVQRVHAHGSSTSLSSSPNPSTPGQGVTFTATVSSVPPGTGTPTGMVAFQEGASVLAQVPLDAGATASFTTAALAPGSNPVSATYLSDAGFASSAGNTNQVVAGPVFDQAGFSATPVASGINQPTAFAWTPDGRMLVLEKPGRVLVVANGVLLGTPALDITASVDSAIEKGLLGICLDPAFAVNGFVYLYYTNLVPENRISRFTMSGNTLVPASETVILDHIDATNGNHNGGHLAIGPDGKLWAAPGDSGTGGAKSQILTPGQFNGKVLRMELNGSPAAGNPFLGDATKEPRIWAWGFRNPWRFTFRPSNGSLYVADVGQSTYEELDVVTPGNNYGWPAAEGTLGGCAGCIPPVFEYDHTVGQTIIGGVFITSGVYPAFLRGKYLFGDYAASWIRYLDFSANDTLVGTLQTFASSAEAPVHFATGPDGAVYYAAIATGKIYRINPPGTSFFTVTPCRATDTRNPAGPSGGPALVANTVRSFPIAGLCGVPSTASAVVANLAAFQPTNDGDLRVYPAGQPAPNASSLNFRAGAVRANNATIPLGASGQISVQCDMPSGGTHFFIDIYGYYE